MKNKFNNLERVLRHKEHKNETAYKNFKKIGIINRKICCRRMVNF